MQKKLITILVSFIIVINLVFPIYADDEIGETDISKDEIENIIETAAEETKIPSINSRYAVIYDRTSRKSFIREK